ncbi:hypothetical protein Tco_0434567 [Tanacetum coccineum]
MSSDLASSEVPGPEEHRQGTASGRNFMPGLKYPEYLAPSDEEVPIEDQLYAFADSPIALSLGYVVDSDPKEDSEDGPVYYPADGATPPSPPAYHTTTRISIRPEAPMPFPSEEEVERLLALPIPPPSPLTPLSSPLPQIPSPPLPPPPSLLHLPLPLPASLFIPLVDRREDTSEAKLPPCKRLCMTALTSRYMVGESLMAAPRPTGGHGADYGFIGTVDVEVRRQRAEEVGYGIRDVWVDPSKTVEETQIYQRVDILAEDREYHYETARLLDQEALVSRETWAHLVGLSSAVHYELQGYRTHTWMQDHRIDAHESLIATLVAQVSSLQGHLVTALGEIRALQARDQTRADAPDGAGSSA